MSIGGHLRKSEKQILELLANSVNDKGLSQKEIIKSTKLSKRAVKYALNRLVITGHITERPLLDDLRTKLYYISRNNNDDFELFDLKVIIEKASDKNPDNHKVGDYFEVIGGKIIIPGNKPFSLYTLGAVLPLLPAKQRLTHKNDWMTTDEKIVCPDPNCGAVLKIERTRLRKFRHSEVSFTSITTGDKND